MSSVATFLRRLSSRLGAACLLGTCVIAATIVSAAMRTERGATADTVPPARVPATVSADGLATIQINGVVWSQVTIGNIVYATGKFSTIRPAGAAPGTQVTQRGSLVAYNITTGNVVASFAHNLNAQGLSITATPDGATVIVGGDFTTVDGKLRSRIAAFSTRTGALLPAFAPAIPTTVRTVTATNQTVFVGGDFVRVGTSTRHRLASFDLRTRRLNHWHPSADASFPTALLMAPGGRRLIAAGRFTTLDGKPAYGIGALDPTTGAVLPWAAHFPIRDAGRNAAITNLSTDGHLMYGSAFVYGPGGNFEGRFAINPANGSLVWMNDCHGDGYSTFVVGEVLYSVGHAHSCKTIGSFAETSPRTVHPALAETTYATGHLSPNTIGNYANFAGRPDSTQLDWYPDLTAGSYTGQHQAAWSVTGNSHYIALGGEFTAVNGVPQQGLVRFAIRALAPNRQAPLASSRLTPEAVASGPNSITVTWQATWDRDNTELSYTLYRNGEPITVINSASLFWNLPTLAFTDINLSAPGGYNYQVVATDPFGNSTASGVVGIYLPTPPPS